MKLQEMVKTLLDKGASRNDLGRFGRKEFSKTIEKLYCEKLRNNPHKLTLRGYFSMAHSELYYAGCGDLTNYVRKETKYDERHKKIEKALGRKQNGDSVSLYMDIEFLVQETMDMSFVFGYLFGESYQMRDSESLQVIRDLIKDKQLLPVFPREKERRIP